MDDDALWEIKAEIKAKDQKILENLKILKKDSNNEDAQVELKFYQEQLRDLKFKKTEIETKLKLEIKAKQVEAEIKAKQAEIVSFRKQLLKNSNDPGLNVDLEESANQLKDLINFRSEITKQVQETDPYSMDRGIFCSWYFTGNVIQDLNVNLKSFWKSLKNIESSNDIIKFDKLPDFIKDGNKSFYVRDAYSKLFDLILLNFLTPGTSKMAITGNPGAGKSVFLYYVMWRLSKETSTEDIILNREKDNGRIYVFTKRSCYMTRDIGKLDGLLSTSSTWYLTDTLNSCPGDVIKAKTIVVSSPARKHYKDFLKYGETAPLHYMPIWTLDELLAARHIYNLSEKEVESHYYKIGGIARYVLEKRENIDSIIASAINRLDIKKFDLIASGDMEQDDRISHLIVHYDVDSTFCEKSLIMGSTFITELALERFIKEEEATLKRFLTSAKHTPLLASLRGNLFEAYAHRILSAGGIFEYCSLDDKTRITCHLNVPKRETERYYEIKSCKSEKYYIPWNPNYPCIDAFAPKIGHFQMTVSLSHPLPGLKMNEIIKDSSENLLYFVIPSTNYDVFKKQGISGKEASTTDIDNKNKKRKVDDSLSFRQFALKLDF
jgi:hypothetical protein